MEGYHHKEPKAESHREVTLDDRPTCNGEGKLEDGEDEDRRS
ncbi:MAG: hypothetical protein WA421_10620 [Nitrososphaeraceae archaeon]